MTGDPVEAGLEVLDKAVRPGEVGPRPRAYLHSMGQEEGGTARESAQPGAVPDPIILEFRYRPEQSDPDSMTEGQAQEEVTRTDFAADELKGLSEPLPSGEDEQRRPK
jgi:hypothetical protein